MKLLDFVALYGLLLMADGAQVHLCGFLFCGSDLISNPEGKP